MVYVTHGEARLAIEQALAKTSTKDVRWVSPTGWTSIDEFADNTLHPDWVRVDKAGGAARAAWVEGGDSLSVKNEGGDTAAELHAMMRPLSGVGGELLVGQAFVTCLRLMGTTNGSHVMGGLVLADGVTPAAGNQVITLTYPAQVTDCRLLTGYQTQTTETTDLVSQYGVETHVRLVRVTATTYRADISPNGLQWLFGLAVITSSIVPTHVGVHSTSWGTALKGVTTYEYLRRMTV